VDVADLNDFADHVGGVLQVTVLPTGVRIIPATSMSRSSIWCFARVQLDRCDIRNLYAPKIFASP
jgi:hypothetical protein